MNTLQIISKGLRKLKENYWAMFTSIKYKEFYAQQYAIFLNRVNWVIIGACLIFSATSLTTWAIWNRLPWLWAALVFTMQVIQVLSPFFPFSKTLIAIKFFLSQLGDLTRNIAAGWLDIEVDNLSDDKIKTLIKKFNARFDELSNRYLSPEQPFQNKCCEKAAARRCKNYFFIHFDVRKDDNNA